MAALSRRRSNVPDVWPGFVDALATLVMVVVFVLMVFTIFQFYLKDVISGRDEALGRLTAELGQINELLATERGTAADLRTRLGETSAALRETADVRTRLQAELTASSALRDRLSADLAATRGRAESAEETAARTATALAETRTRAECAEQAGARSAADLEAVRRAMAEAQRTIAADREQIEVQLIDLAAQRYRADELATLRRDLEVQVAALGRDLASTRQRAEGAEAAAARTSAELEASREAIAEAERATAIDREHIEMQVQALATLRRNVEDLTTLRGSLEARVAALDVQIAQRRAELGESQQALTAERAASERRRQLSTELQSDLTRVRASLAAQIAELRLMRAALDAERAEVEQRRTAERDLAGQIDRLRTQLMRATGETEDTRGALAAEQQARSGDVRALAEAQRRRQEGEQRATSLDQEVAGLRAELARLNGLLGTDQQQLAVQSAQITDLNQRLTAALASRVEELTRYRSEFFGRLRTVFEGRPGFRIEGDRFILESEVLFSVGSADLGVGGFDQLDRIAETLRELMTQIPPEVPWVLQIEGHTDRRPVAGRIFRSNWELSTARAISVMRFLVDRGLPPDRIAVAGYGEFRPIDRGDTEAAFSRNRRIELRFTSR